MEAAEELFQRANALFVDEDYAGALQAYSQAIDQSPQPRADHFAARAAAHLYMRNQMEALDDCSRAIQLDPTHDKAHLRKGIALFELGEYEMAHKVFVRGKRINQKSPGWCDWIKRCEEAIQNEQGTSHPRQRKPEAAPTPSAPRPGSKVVSEADKKKAEQEKVLGNTAFGKKEFKKAVLHYSTAITLDPDNHVYYSNRSMVNARLGAHSRALEDALATVALSPSWPKGYYRQGTALMALDRHAEAVDALQKSLDLAHEEKEKEEINRALQQAIELARLQSHPAYAELKQASKLSDRAISETLKTNIAKLRTEEFAKAITSLTVNLGTRWRCMRVVVVDDEGVLLRIQTPNSFLPSDKSIIAKLQSGDAKLAQLFVHVDKSTTPTAHRQEYVFEEWRPTQPQRNSALPSLSNLTSKPLTVLQKKVLELTAAEANAMHLLNTFIPGLLQ